MRRIIGMVVGNLILGIGIAVFRTSLLGNDPYSAMMMAGADHLPISYGTLTLIVNAVFFIAEFLWGKHYIGIGTFANWFLHGRPSCDSGGRRADREHRRFAVSVRRSWDRALRQFVYDYEGPLSAAVFLVQAGDGCDLHGCLLRAGWYHKHRDGGVRVWTWAVHSFF